MQTILNQGNDFDWLDSPFLCSMLIILIVASPCLIIWEFGERHPAFNIRLFTHRNFTIGVIGLSVGFLSIQGLLSLLIVQLQVTLGYSSFLAGMAYLPMILLAAPVTVLMHVLPKVSTPACWSASTCLVSRLLFTGQLPLPWIGWTGVVCLSHPLAASSNSDERIRGHPCGTDNGRTMICHFMPKQLLVIGCSAGFMLLISACAWIPPADKPAGFLKTPALEDTLSRAGHDESLASSEHRPHERWWREFGCSELNGLMALALKENIGLKVATARLRHAQALVRV